MRWVGVYPAYPAALTGTSISYVSPTCIRRASITGTLSHSRTPLPSPPPSFVSNTDVHPFIAHTRTIRPCRGNGGIELV